MDSNIDERLPFFEPSIQDERDGNLEDSPDEDRLSKEPPSAQNDSDFEKDQIVALLTRVADRSSILEYSENIPFFRPDYFEIHLAEHYPPDAWIELLKHLGYTKPLYLNVGQVDPLAKVSNVLKLTISIMKAICKVESNTLHSPFLPKFQEEPFQLCFSEIVDWVHYIFHTGDHSFSKLIPRWHPKKGPGRRLVACGSWFDQVLIQCILSYLAPVADTQWLSVWRRNRTLAPIDPPGTYLSYNEHLLFRPWVEEFRSWQNALCTLNRSNKYLVRMDIYNFYNSIDRNRVTHRLLGLVNVPILRDLLERYLDFRWDPDGRPFRGVPVGEPISRLLANLYLEPLDRFVLETLQLPYLRYVDDITIGAKSLEHANEILKRIEEFLGERLELTLNYNKCCIHEGSRPSICANFILSQYLDSLQEKFENDDHDRQTPDKTLYSKLWTMFEGEFPEDLISSLLVEGISLDDPTDDLKQWRERAIRTMKKFSAYRLAKYFKDENVIPFLEELLTKNDPESVRLAILCHSRFEDGVDPQAFSAATSSSFFDRNPEAGVMLLKAFSKKSDSFSKEFFEMAYKSKMPLVRSAACEYTEDDLLLARALHDKDPTVRRAALSKLSKTFLGSSLAQKGEPPLNSLSFAFGFETTLLIHRLKGTPLLPPGPIKKRPPPMFPFPSPRKSPQEESAHEAPPKGRQDALPESEENSDIPF